MTYRIDLMLNLTTGPMIDSVEADGLDGAWEQATGMVRQAYGSDWGDEHLAAWSGLGRIVSREAPAGTEGGKPWTHTTTAVVVTVTRK